MSANRALNLDIIIVGAGIAGLCAAVGLVQQGHNITILEGAHELAPVGIGLHIPPNATRVLKHFGLLEQLEKDAFLPSTYYFRRWSDSSIIAKFPANQPAHADALPYWSMRRSDYQRHLYEAATNAGCTIRLSSRVDRLDLDAPSAVLTTGEILKADMIVIADGVKSALRDQMLPEVRTPLQVNPMASYRGFVDKKDLLADPIVAKLFQEPATNLWTGYDHSFIIYPSGNDSYTMGATFPASTDEVMSWTAPAKNEEALEEFSHFDSIVSRIIASAKSLKQWRLAEVTRLPRWTSTSGKVVLIGDAAHGMLQFLAQGAAMATEDSAALAECVGRVKSIDDIPKALKAFELTRKWRCEVIQANSRRSGYSIHVPDGEEQEQRDLAMNGLPQTGLWKADPGPLMDHEVRKFIYEHNVIEYTRQVLDKLAL